MQMHRKVMLAIVSVLALSPVFAGPQRAETAYVTPEASVVRTAAAEPQALEARSRSWLVSNAIKLYTTVASGFAIFFR